MEIRTNEDFVKTLDEIIRKKPGISTRAAAINYCVDIVKMEMEKEQKEEGK